MALPEIPPGAPRAAIEEAIKSAERAAELTQQMLSYSGKGRFFLRSVILTEFVTEMITLLEGSIPRKVQLRFDLLPQIPPIEADAGQLRQVVLNLVSNAAEAMTGVAGTVTVRTGVRQLDEPRSPTPAGPRRPTADRYVFLEVTDNGCGMDQLMQQRIFDPFYTTKFTGRGLGLAAVQGIVRGHGGFIEVESAPGLGSTFRVLFPELLLKTPPISTAPPVSSGKKQTILIVEDEEAVRKMARAMLEQAGFAVLTATNGEEAVTTFAREAHQISAVLLDMTMPVMTGMQALTRLRAIRSDVPVVMSSGYSDVEASAESAAELGDAFLKKPYTAKQLVGMINGLLGDRV